jgi:hypothetical protein
MLLRSFGFAVVAAAIVPKNKYYESPTKMNGT